MILITGCTGYIGSRLCKRLLKKGYKVCGFIKTSETEKASPLIQLGLIPYYGDLLDFRSLQEIADDIDFVYHLAGIHSTYINTYNLYVQGTINLLHSFFYNSKIPVVLASNSAVYAGVKKKHLENTKLTTNNPLGKITIEMEKVVMNLCERYAILRIGEIYGDGELNPFNFCTKGITLIGDGANYTSKLHIEDLINILFICYESLPQGIFNLCDELPIRQREFFQYIEKLSKTKCVNWKSNIEIDERIMLSIHGLRTINISMDNSLIKNALNYKFIFYTYKYGLEYLYENRY